MQLHSLELLLDEYLLPLSSPPLGAVVSILPWNTSFDVKRTMLLYPRQHVHVGIMQAEYLTSPVSIA